MNIKKYIIGIIGAMSVSIGFTMHAAAKENVNIASVFRGQVTPCLRL